MVEEKSGMNHIKYKKSQKQAILTILKEKGYIKDKTVEAVTFSNKVCMSEACC